MTDFTFHHGAISVSDLDEAVAWYGAMLGFELEKRFWIEPANARAAMIKKGPLRFEIFEVKGMVPLSDDRRHPLLDIKIAGNKHVAFRVADMEDFITEIQSKGADIAFVVRESFGKGCFIRDCAGNLIEFVEESND